MAPPRNNKNRGLVLSQGRSSERYYGTYMYPTCAW